jgi:hypothetical protein
MAPYARAFVGPMVGRTRRYDKPRDMPAWNASLT